MVSATAKSSRSIRATSVSDTIPDPNSAISFTRQTSCAMVPPPATKPQATREAAPTSLHALLADLASALHFLKAAARHDPFELCPLARQKDFAESFNIGDPIRHAMDAAGRGDRLD